MSESNQPAVAAEDQLIEEETEKAESQAGNSNPPSTSHDDDAEKAPEPEPPGSDAPDGGAAAWLVVLGTWCASFCSFGWLNSVGVFQEYYQIELLSNYSPSTISWIPSLQIFFMMGMGPFVGAIYDRYGVRWLLLGGSLLHIFGIMMASLGTEYYQILLAQGLCSGLGVSAIFQPSATCLAGWFNHKRGAAFGISFTGSSLGGIIFPIMVSHLIRNVGFGWAMRTCAFLMLFLLIIANLTVRPFHPPQPHKATGAQLAKPFTELQFVLLAVGFFLFSYGFFVPINYLPVQALSAGMSSDLAGYLLPILNAGSLFGRLFAGFLGDKIGRYNIFIVVCYLSGIYILALWLPDSSDAALIAFAVLFGFFSGAYVSLILPLVIAISPIAELGFRTGVVMFVIAIGGLTTNPINGAIIDGAGGWKGLKIFSGVFCLAGTTFVLVARVRKTGWTLFTRF
ncbi:MFS general substrate transporter [Mytilinidion resinicola]|uniref:MFS general substrate transporter n=1 Tax=Mytilinidion resinicola TaxID=574789 RepID=A0A6A6Y8N6_9PEZI|nr:MFS general substrate transporter [Mytilinidion resinicola]KAF2805191.1 MFS general substrate transporter [Mytilinidion resinicola]